LVELKVALKVAGEVQMAARLVVRWVAAEVVQTGEAVVVLWAVALKVAGEVQMAAWLVVVVVVVVRWVAAAAVKGMLPQCGQVCHNHSNRCT